MAQNPSMLPSYRTKSEILNVVCKAPPDLAAPGIWSSLSATSLPPCAPSAEAQLLACPASAPDLASSFSHAACSSGDILPAKPYSSFSTWLQMTCSLGSHSPPPFPTEWVLLSLCSSNVPWTPLFPLSTEGTDLSCSPAPNWCSADIYRRKER